MSVHASVVAAHRRLFEAAETGRDLHQPWSEFSRAAAEQRSRLPMHLAEIFRLAESQAARRQTRDIAILDHGCGGALSLLLLLADGFTGIHGIDMPTARCEALNRVTRDVFSIPEPRFFRYTGERLPFNDASFDVVFSQQVVEHVREADLAAYYAEEGRVLREGGVAYHQVPHRLVPYDTHSQTWLLHWLPRPLQMAGYRALGRPAAYLDSMLFLRSPATHFAMARKHIGPVEDLTARRLVTLPDAERYDGPLRLRRLVHRIAHAPLIGGIATGVFKNLIMLETVATKTGPRQGGTARA